MYDWDQYYKRNTAPKDDPWDITPDARRKKREKLIRRKPEAHDPDPNHVIGSCGPDVSFSSAPRVTRKKKTVSQTKGSKVKAITALVVAVCAVLSAVPTLLSELDFNLSDVFAPTPEQVSPTIPAGKLPFDNEEEYFYDGDEDVAGDGVDIWEHETGPSEIIVYTGQRDLTLTLEDAEGLAPLTYQEIYTKVLPSVVTITVFNDYSGAYATGIVVSEDGYILTNQHVTACQTDARVTTWDNKTYTAVLVGEDPNSDLALLKIDAQGLTPAQFAHSDSITVGDECFAIGNPLGVNYRASFTNGIISSVSRNVTLNDYTMDLIQTNTALNSGNSGGPLINIYGQVIGVNNMKLVNTEVTVEGMGFAIPTAKVKQVVDSIIRYGTVEHPVIGITCYAVTEGDADGSEVSGVLVYTISPESDACQQGLQVGDVMTHINGTRIYQVDDVDLSIFRVGDRITVTVWREGEVFDITFALVEQNDLN